MDRPFYITSKCPLLAFWVVIFSNKWRWPQNEVSNSLKVDGPSFRREIRATQKRKGIDMRHMITFSNFLTGPKIGQRRLLWPITITFVFPFQDGGVLWTSGILESFNLNVNLRKDVFDFNFTAMLKNQFFVLFQGLIKGRFLSNFWTFWIQNFGF